MAKPYESLTRELERAGNGSVGASRAKRVVDIAPARPWPGIDFTELWAYRGLLGLFFWRDIKSRYTQTVLGAGWAIVQPVLSMVIFSVIFGRFARIPSDGVPYPIFSLAALVPWSYFSSVINGSSGSLVSNRSLLIKVYFPRLLIPAAPVAAALVDFAIAFSLLLVIMVSFGRLPRVEALVAVPLLLIIASTTALGTGLWLAALNVRYRDVRVLTPFLLQIWMYSSPIVYPLSLVPKQYHAIYALNPMCGVISGFRAALLGTPAPPWWQLALSVVAAMTVLAAGALYFRHTERLFADVA